MHFELARSAPAAGLRSFVREYAGWIDYAGTTARLRELPSGNVPLIIHFEGTVQSAFTAGLHETATVVESSGTGAGLQVTFTALGARLFFNRPLADLTNLTIGVDDVLGSSIANRLEASVREARTWDERFAVMDREIQARVAAARQPAAPVAWAVGHLVRTNGRTTIRELLGEIGWSEKHFARQFTRDIGVTPKMFARILRFHRAVRTLTRADMRLVDLALDCGYFDQAHFARDFREFAGVTASELLASQRPDGSGFVAV